MFNFEVIRTGKMTNAYLLVEDGDDTVSYCVCFDPFDWFDNLHASATTMIGTTRKEMHTLEFIEDAPDGYARIEHSQHFWH